MWSLSQDTGCGVPESQTVILCLGVTQPLMIPFTQGHTASLGEWLRAREVTKYFGLNEN